MIMCVCHGSHIPILILVGEEVDLIAKMLSDLQPLPALEGVDDEIEKKEEKHVKPAAKSRRRTTKRPAAATPSDHGAQGDDGDDDEDDDGKNGSTREGPKITYVIKIVLLSIGCQSKFVLVPS